MYHVSAQGVDERMINVHIYYYDYCEFLYKKQRCTTSGIHGISLQFHHVIITFLVTVACKTQRSNGKYKIQSTTSTDYINGVMAVSTDQHCMAHCAAAPNYNINSHLGFIDFFSSELSLFPSALRFKRECQNGVC